MHIGEIVLYLADEPDKTWAEPGTEYPALVVSIVDGAANLNVTVDGGITHWCPRRYPSHVPLRGHCYPLPKWQGM